LLEGTGKKGRHVKIRRLEDTETEGLRALMKAVVKLGKG
jgi:hypothetical protein